MSAVMKSANVASAQGKRSKGLFRFQGDPKMDGEFKRPQSTSVRLIKAPQGKSQRKSVDPSKIKLFKERNNSKENTIPEDLVCQFSFNLPPMLSPIKTSESQKKISDRLPKSFYDLMNLPPMMSPIKGLNTKRIQINPFAFQTQNPRLIDDELRNMIDAFARNIENLANDSNVYRETCASDNTNEMFMDGRKRKTDQSKSQSMKRQRAF